MASRWLEDEYSENVLFYSLSTEKTVKLCVLDIKGKRVAASGSVHLVTVDKDDNLSAVLANPLTEKTMALPRLPEFFHNNGTHGKVTGDEGAIIVVLNDWLSENMALWYRSDSIIMESWVIVPGRKFRSRMPMVEQEEIPVHDIEDAIVVQSRGSCARSYIIPASRDFAVLSGRNAFYYLWKQFDTGDAYNALCKKCLASGQLTEVKWLPEDWQLSDEWFMPTLKY
ncbi:hypothetical protein E2562_038689 [Oryza meyeriana var. granulata]|uniref:KIB1-4 beta-propeller domain-containing protein n=1 Tax=Oryza meyeriana var. granulata TaxID=110450 RepID=A0A6G1E7P7_9ORYZ|nr:hypothetical protein E2562_038689 [Oryza meyeriana var. granulata]